METNEKRRRSEKRRLERGASTPSGGVPALPFEAGAATYHELVMWLAERNELARADVDDLLKDFLFAIEENVWKHGRMSVPGLGTFKRKRFKARRGVVDPQKASSADVPERDVITCRVASTWRTRG